jgi:hypothetical protein
MFLGGFQQEHSCHIIILTGTDRTACQQLVQLCLGGPAWPWRLPCRSAAVCTQTRLHLWLSGYDIIAKKPLVARFSQPLLAGHLRVSELAGRTALTQACDVPAAGGIHRARDSRSVRRARALQES